MVKSALIKQELIECLPQYKVADSTLYAVYPDKNFVPLRVKAFIEQLKTYLSEI
jgi:DNA-binding transcriptional LysR family regulator